MIWVSRIFRALALAIAVAAAIDPAMALMRGERALIAVVDTGGGEAAEISKRLGESFDVHAGPIAGAAATIVAGDALPDPSIVTSGALFAALPAASAPRVEIEALSAPLDASSGATIPLAVRARAAGMRGRSLTAELFAGSLAVDSITRAVTSDNERFDLTMALPPSGAGLLSARVVVRDSANRAIAADRHVAVDVRDRRWRLLVADPRPSWTSTFVRRALEDDRRFDVASRVGTSRNAGVESGAAPALADTAALFAFDAVMIGAPAALGAAEVRSLERYARERGGSVILLLDQPEPGPAMPLVGRGVRDAHGVERVRIPAAAGVLVATEFAMPSDAAGVTVLAHAPIAGADAPVIWSAPLGAGRVIVNGALDAWRYRTRENGGFGKFWRDAIAAAAAASPPPLALTADTRGVAPGQVFDVRAIVRDVQLSDPSRPAPPVDLVSAADFWPTAERGVFQAAIKAPEAPGFYEIEVQGVNVQGFHVQRFNVPGFSGRETFRYVVGDADRVSEPALVAAWTTSRGGTVLNDDAAGVVAKVQAAVKAARERVETHPMRSMWWLPVFVFLVGGEWWMRRRRGER